MAYCEAGVDGWTLIVFPEEWEIEHLQSRFLQYLNRANNRIWNIEEYLNLAECYCAAREGRMFSYKTKAYYNGKA